MGYFDYVGGGRRSDPLRSLDIAPQRAPDWALNRVVTAQDVAPHSLRSKGVNGSHFDSLRFAVTPMTADPTKDPAAVAGGAGNPAVEIMVWSEQAQLFLPFPSPLTHAAGGAGVPYIVEVPEANGSIVACLVTSAPGGVVAISVQGYDKNPNK